MDRPGMQTPWGISEHVETIAPGIYRHRTERHGGLHLDPTRQAALEVKFEFPTFAGGPWYEEDADWAAVAIAFPEHFTTEQLMAAVRIAQAPQLQWERQQNRPDRWADVKRYLAGPGEDVALQALGRAAETAEAFRTASLSTHGNGWTVTVRRGQERRSFPMTVYPEGDVWHPEEVHLREIDVLKPDDPGPRPYSDFEEDPTTSGITPSEREALTTLVNSVGGPAVRRGQ